VLAGQLNIEATHMPTGRRDRHYAFLRSHLYREVQQLLFDHDLSRYVPGELRAEQRLRSSVYTM
jgi:hypothetical protein